MKANNLYDIWYCLFLGRGKIVFLWVSIIILYFGSSFAALQEYLFNDLEYCGLQLLMDYCCGYFCTLNFVLVLFAVI